MNQNIKYYTLSSMYKTWFILSLHYKNEFEFFKIKQIILTLLILNNQKKKITLFAYINSFREIKLDYFQVVNLKITTEVKSLWSTA